MRDQDMKLAEALARRISAMAPGPWAHACWRGIGDLASTSSQLAYHLPNGGVHLPPADFADRDLLQKLVDAARDNEGWEELLVELTCEPSGCYTVIGTDTVVRPGYSGSGHYLTLARDYVPVEQGGGGPGPQDATEAGDRTLAVQRLDRYVRRCRELGVAANLREPATDITRAEKLLGQSLPRDLHELYRHSDGEASGGLFEGYAWLPLHKVVRAHVQVCEPVWFGWELSWNKVVYDASPLGTVRRCSGHRGWLPFASDATGNFLAVDMSPAQRGRPGQVIRVGHDHETGPQYVAPSVTELLGRYVRQLDEGAFSVDYLEDPPRLELASPRVIWPPVCRVMGGADLASPQPSLQSIRLRGGDRPDLAMLEAVENLREFGLHDVTRPDLAPLAGMPVESLHLDINGTVDLRPLAGHRTLRSLRLSTTAFTDITPLRRVPGLRGLDLSGVPAADLTVLTDLREVRFLALRGDQWADLGDPASLLGLAGAGLIGESPLAEALTWASTLGMDATEVWNRSGRIET